MAKQHHEAASGCTGVALRDARRSDPFSCNTGTAASGVAAGSRLCRASVHLGAENLAPQAMVSSGAVAAANKPRGRRVGPGIAGTRACGTATSRLGGSTRVLGDITNIDRTRAAGGKPLGTAATKQVGLHRSQVTSQAGVEQHGPARQALTETQAGGTGRCRCGFKAGCGSCGRCLAQQLAAPTTPAAPIGPAEAGTAPGTQVAAPVLQQLQKLHEPDVIAQAAPGPVPGSLGVSTAPTGENASVIAPLDLVAGASASGLRAVSSSGYPAPLSAREAGAGVGGAASISRRAITQAVAPATSAIASSALSASATTVAVGAFEEANAFERDGENVQRVAEYATEILDHLFKEESVDLPRPDYMEHQPDINGRMRAILIDWLVEVHMKYRLRHETLFLTVNLIDRYLARIPVLRRRLQLVGVVAMFVAAKFEEIDPPTASDFAYITDNSFTRDDVVVMECNMLSSLGFQIVVPTVAHFLDRFQRANRCDDQHREVAQYLLELALLDIHATQHEPSHLVAAALLLSNELLGRHPLWPMAMVQQTRRTEHTLRACAEELRALLLDAPGGTLQAVRKKYLRQQHHSVARFLQNAVGPALAPAPATAVSLSAARGGA